MIYDNFMGMGGTAVLSEFALDAGVEGRVHAVDWLSVGVHFDIAGTVRSAFNEGWDTGGVKLFVQAYSNPAARGTFSTGPYLGVGLIDDPVAVLGARVGGEVYSPEDGVALGLFARPGTWLNGDGRCFEMYFEMTWMFYPEIRR